MTDKELNAACAVAMGYKVSWDTHIAPPAHHKDAVRVSEGKKAPKWYDPLHNDAQAMELLKQFPLDVFYPRRENGKHHVFWRVLSDVESDDLNRAIVRCVAQVQAEK